MYISYKEANETRYWFELLEKSNLTKIPMKSYLENINELIRILWSITKTTKNNL